MSATDELRRLLDERGVEYETDDKNGLRETNWCGMTAFQLSPTAKMTMIVTPKQAIAATLGGNGKSRWAELFGTPERAAKTLAVNCYGATSDACDTCVHADCDGKLRNSGTYQTVYDALLEWLRCRE